MRWLEKNYERLTVEHENEFKAIFGVQLRDFMRDRMGFDLVKFDILVVKPQNGMDTRTAIEQRYGTRAVELVQILF